MPNTDTIETPDRDLSPQEYERACEAVGQEIAQAFREILGEVPEAELSLVSPITRRRWRGRLRRPAVSARMSLDGILLAQVHAPHTLTIAGKEYRGGQFIPQDALDKMQPVDKQDLLSKEHLRAADEGEILAHFPAGAGADHTKATFAGEGKFHRHAADLIGRHARRAGEEFMQELSDEAESEKPDAEEAGKRYQEFIDRIVGEGGLAEQFTAAVTGHLKKAFPGNVADADIKALADKVESASNAIDEAAYDLLRQVQSGDIDEDGLDFDALHEATRDFHYALDEAAIAATDAVEARIEADDAAAQELVDGANEETEDMEEGDIEEYLTGRNEELAEEGNKFRLVFEDGEIGVVEAEASLSIEDDEGHLHSESDGRFVGKGKGDVSEDDMMSEDDVIEHVKKSPQFAGKEIDWNRYAQRNGIEGNFSKGNVSVDKLHDMIKSGHLRISQNVNAEDVANKAESKTLNPIIITKEPGRQMLVVDGTHSLLAARKAGMNTVAVIFSSKLSQYF